MFAVLVSRMSIETIFAHDKFDLAIHVFRINGTALFITHTATGLKRFFVRTRSAINVEQAFRSENPGCENQK